MSLCFFKYERFFNIYVLASQKTFAGNVEMGFCRS